MNTAKLADKMSHGHMDFERKTSKEKRQMTDK